MTGIFFTLPFYSLFDRDKLPLISGKLYFYNDNTRTLEPVFSDPGLNNPHDNPLTLDSAARVPPLYATPNMEYYIELRTMNDVLVWSFGDFTPGTGGGGTVNQYIDFDNLVINGQFRFHEQTFWSPAPTSETKIAGDAFYFESDEAGGVIDTLSFERFNLDQVSPPDATPIYFLRYHCTNPGVSAVKKDVIYTIKDVRSLTGQEITYSFAGRSIGAEKTLELILEQNFGTGGSPHTTNFTSVDSFTLNSSWQTFHTTFTVPTLPSAGLGTDGNDCIKFRLRIPLQQTSDIGITNLYIKDGNFVSDYPYLTYAETEAMLNASVIPSATRDNAGDVITYNVTSYNTPGSYDLAPAFPIGASLIWNYSVIPSGFLLENGQVVPKQGLFGRLYSLLQYNFTARHGISSESSGINQINLRCDDKGTVATNPVDGAGVTLNITTPGSSSARQVVTATFSAATSITTGAYFQISSTAELFSVVYIVDNQYLTSPSISGSHVIFVNVASGDTATQVRDKTLAVLQLMPPNGMASAENYTTTSATNVVTATSLKIGAVSNPVGTTGITTAVVTPGTTSDYAVISITCSAASSIAASSYFIISTQSYNIVFWIIKDGTGQQPTVGSATHYMPILLQGTDTDAQVASRIASALNYFFFQVPDKQGMFIRGVSGSNPFNTDPGPRISTVGGTASGVGTYQWQDFESHTHIMQSHSGTGGAPPYMTGTADESVSGNTQATLSTGGLETRPINQSVYFIIKGY
jgi:hypothetical protein